MTVKESLTNYFNKWKDDPRGTALSAEGAWVLGGAVLAAAVFPGILIPAVVGAVVASEPGRDAVTYAWNKVAPKNLLVGETTRKPRLPGNKPE